MFHTGVLPEQKHRRIGITFRSVWVLLSLLLFSTTAVAKSRLKLSIAPLAGYDPTYSVFFGTGFFTQWKDQFKTSLLLIYTFKNVYRIEPGFIYKIDDTYSLLGEYQFSNGFEPFYGVNNRNNPQDVKNVFGYQYITRTGVKRQHDRNYSTTAYIPFFYWDPDHRRNDESHKQLLPLRTHYGLELANIYDHTVKKARLTTGWSFRHDIHYHAIPNDLLRTEMDLKYYFPFSTNVGLAFSTKGGLSYGKRDYFDNFRLGGTDRLRGYLKNRFTGAHFVLQQSEIRFPLPVKDLYGVGFVDVGEIFNPYENAFLKYTYGFGARYALPPDDIEVIRIDVGFARDQWGVFFDFGQSF